MRDRFLLLAALLAVPEFAQAQAPRVHKDIVYAAVDGTTLALDLYMPAGASAPPLVVWVHGGRWRTGDKTTQVPVVLAEHGFALASLDFRQAGAVRFPAMVHDIKAAIRFLRARSHAHGYRADRIAVAGRSSGGHLAALVGVTNGHAQLEGTVGAERSESSAVQAIVSYFPATNLTTILQQSTPFGLGVREPALQALLGGLPDEAPDLARLASPVLHVDAGDPPLFLLHGDQDPQMPINQSHELEGAYERHGLDVTFDVVHGGVHGDRDGTPLFFSDAQVERVVAFLQRTIGR